MNIIITGASSRIGQNIALELGKKHNLVLHYYKNKDIILDIVNKLKEYNTNISIIQADLTKEYNSFVDNVLKINNNVDVLINNFSTFNENKISNIEKETLFNDINENAWSPFVISRDFFNKAKTGKIINILDAKIYGYDKEHFAFHISKKILETLTYECAIEFAPNFTVNAVAIGLMEFDTKFSGETLPLKKKITTKEINNTIKFLISSEVITGQVIYLDSGRHLKKG